jgi:hypothetical protein
MPKTPSEDLELVSMRFPATLLKKVRGEAEENHMALAHEVRVARPNGRISAVLSSALFPYTVLSYQNAAGVRYTPPRREATEPRLSVL